MNIYKARNLQKLLSKNYIVINEPQAKNYEHIGFDDNNNLIYLVSTLLVNKSVVISNTKSIENTIQLKEQYNVDTIIQPGRWTGELYITCIIRID